MSIATLEEEITDDVRLNQAMRQRFSEHRQALIEFSETWVAT